MLPNLPIPGLNLPAKPILLLIAFYLAIWFAGKEADRLGIDGNEVWNIGFYALIIASVVARLGYIVQHWSVYSGNVAAIISLQGGTFYWQAGLIAAALFAGSYIAWKKLPSLKLADALAGGVALFLPFYSLGNLAAGDAYGLPTTMPWGIRLWGATRQPTQIYLFLATALLFAIVFWRRKRAGDGMQALWLTVGYALSRLLVDGWRAGSAVWGNGYRQSQVISLLVLVLALTLLIVKLPAGEES